MYDNSAHVPDNAPLSDQENVFEPVYHCIKCGAIIYEDDIYYDFDGDTICDDIRCLENYWSAYRQIAH